MLRLPLTLWALWYQTTLKLASPPLFLMSGRRDYKYILVTGQIIIINNNNRLLTVWTLVRHFTVKVQWQKYLFPFCSLTFCPDSHLVNFPTLYWKAFLYLHLMYFYFCVKGWSVNVNVLCLFRGAPSRYCLTWLWLWPVNSRQLSSMLPGMKVQLWRSWSKVSSVKGAIPSVIIWHVTVK